MASSTRLVAVTAHAGAAATSGVGPRFHSVRSPTYARRFAVRSSRSRAASQGTRSSLRTKTAT
eukprot:2171739-Lingulodinium_polyedra.AAC.1